MKASEANSFFKSIRKGQLSHALLEATGKVSIFKFFQEPVELLDSHKCPSLSAHASWFPLHPSEPNAFFCTIFSSSENWLDEMLEGWISTWVKSSCSCVCFLRLTKVGRHYSPFKFLWGFLLWINTENVELRLFRAICNNRGCWFRSHVPLLCRLKLAFPETRPCIIVALIYLQHLFWNAKYYLLTVS